jgi:Uncharacterized protein predicted to be involved in DNA repair (RAMP superfamily)
MSYTHRYIARIILKAETALFVGSGENSLIYDALVQRDHHGFPMIQGASLTGVLRHGLEAKDGSKYWESFFGFGKREEKEGSQPSDGEGSKIKISSAYLLFPNGKIAEGILEDKSYDYAKDLDIFTNLPTRQHVRITHKGVAKKHGLFENEVVYKGCRFLFEIELIGDESDEKKWEALLHQLGHPLFRIGQGTRNGYGKLSVECCKSKMFDLRIDKDFKEYLNFNPSLNASNNTLVCKKIPEGDNELIKYTLQLIPDDFFIFGSGYGDELVDNTPFVENVLHYDKGNFVLKPHTVIPGSSIKGALSHRTCFYFNKLKSNPVLADKIDKGKFCDLSQKYVGTSNKAVATLFGVGAGDEAPQRGRVIIDDLFYKSDEVKNEKIFNHVAIDRFTGGALDGALFSERVSQFEEKNEKFIILNIYLENWENAEDKEKENTVIMQAFEESLKDVCRGLLPLGGMTTKGHGLFSGTFLKIDKKNNPL